MVQQFKSLVVASAVACLAAGSLAAQSPAPQAKPAPAKAAPMGYVPPRAPDGHPDLTGVYDAATMTPMERPAEYGGRLVLTPAEAAAVEQQLTIGIFAGATTDKSIGKLTPLDTDPVRADTRSTSIRYFAASTPTAGWP